MVENRKGLEKVIRNNESTLLGAFFVGADEVLIWFNGSREQSMIATPCREFSFTRNGRNPSSAIEITAEKIDYKQELKDYFV